LYCDNIPAPEDKIEAFANQNRECLVIYRTRELQSWWNLLDKEWKNIFKKHLSAVFTHNESNGNDNKLIPDKEDLHKIINLRVINIQLNYDIKELVPLAMLEKLRNLQISGTRVTDLNPLSGLQELESLDISENPVSSLEPVVNLSKVKYLNIENTPIEELDPIAGWQYLEELNCAGTLIKDLKPLSELLTLKIINCANTEVRTLKHIEHLRIKKLICFNTRISTSRLENFLQENPEVEVMYY
jgi:Leucine-rich repeat (LRR) protein